VKGAPVKVDELEATLRQAFPDSDVEIIDLTGTNDHYQARIVSKSFEGKGKLEQHRLVYAALGEAMKGPVHALALSTYSPTQWEKSKN
jgi:stress-induced morphogen